MSKRRTSAARVFRDERRAVRRDQRVDAGLDAGEERRIVGDRRAERVAVDGAARDRAGRDVAKRAGSRTAARVDPVDGGVGVPDRNPRRREESGRRGLAHADGAGEAQQERPSRHPANTAARRASSTSGATPNQRSKPGAA